MNISDLHRRFIAFKSGEIDPDVRAFLTVTGIQDNNIIKPLNEFVLGLKENSIWAKADVIYPFVGSTAFTHKFNLKDPRDLDEAFRATFENIFHSSDGVQRLGSGVIFYNTHWKTNQHTEQNNNSVFVFVNTTLNSSTTSTLYGSRINSTTNRPFFLYPIFTGTYRVRNFNNSALIVSNPQDESGFFGVSRLNENNFISYSNGNSFVISEPSVSVNIDLDLYGMARNTGNTSVDSASGARQCFFWAGKGLTSQECDDLYYLVLKLQQDLNRELVS